MKLILQKNAKFAPIPPAAGGWGLHPQTPKTAPQLRIFGYAPGCCYNKNTQRTHIDALYLVAFQKSKQHLKMFIAETRTFGFQNVFAHAEKSFNWSARGQRGMVLVEQLF